MPQPAIAPPASTFSVEIVDKIAHIQFNRPQAFNSMTKAFWSEFPAAVRRIDADALARALIITAEGKHFCSGMDVSVFADLGATNDLGMDSSIRNEAFRQFVLVLQNSFSVLQRARLPVIAAVQGGCIGGAVDLVTACDMRFCSKDAFFVIQEINIGMMADVGTFPRLCHLLPDGLVRELAFTGRKMLADEALRLGFVNAVFENAADLHQHVREVAHEIARKSPVAIAGSKRVIQYAQSHGIEDALDYVATWQSGMFSPAQIAEAFAAKNEKRNGDFPDLLPLRSEM